ncbi:MAG: hypothetical protein NW205_07890 [Hyphomicrobiaceae bacterium]|nr:hypothetical protein [Hyphomicrobiaceae bacterium]
MSTDYAEMERELLAWLENDTGRDLSGWLAAIAATGLTDRNAIIDWLRQQGFIFANASWIERIHNNAGRPIYLDAVPASRRPGDAAGARKSVADMPAAPPVAPATTARALPDKPVPPADPRSHQHAAVVPVAPGVGLGATAAPPGSPAAHPGSPATNTPASPPVTAPPPASPLPLPADVTAHLARARAYAPLATHLVRVLLAAVPGTTLTLAGDAVLLTRAGPATPYAAILPSPKDVRLLLALDDQPSVQPFEKMKPAGLPPALAGRFTHGLALTDARRVDEGVIAHARRAAGRPQD